MNKLCHVAEEKERGRGRKQETEGEMEKSIERES